MKKILIAAICSGVMIFAPMSDTEAAKSQIANAVQATEEAEMQQLRGYGPPPPPPPRRPGPPHIGGRPHYPPPPPPPPPHRPGPPPRHWR